MQAALEAAFTVAFEKVLARFPPREDERLAVACSDRPAVAIKQHLAAIDKWSSTIAFRESDRPRLVGDLFVDLDLQLIPRHQSLPNGGVSAHLLRAWHAAKSCCIAPTSCGCIHEM